MRIKALIVVGLVLTLVSWVAVMVSFWLPDVLGEALRSTSLVVGLPGLGLAVIPYVFWQEIEEYHEKLRGQTRPLRCTDCQTKILNAGGTTVGDRIEGELMISGGPSDWRSTDEDRDHFGRR